MHALYHDRRARLVNVLLMISNRQRNQETSPELIANVDCTPAAEPFLKPADSDITSHTHIDQAELVTRSWLPNQAVHLCSSCLRQTRGRPHLIALWHHG
jgi:hypothetical protein